MNKYFVGPIGIWGEDDRFIAEVLVKEEYRFLFNYDTVVDLGANIGTFSLFIYPYAKNIFAVEPNPKALFMLDRTIFDNHLSKIVTIERAIAGHDGDRFFIDADDKLKQYGSGSLSDKTGITVKGITIETLMKEWKIEYIDLLKVDIEGGEVELFESDAFRNVANKIGTIIGEYHDGERRARIARAISHSGFRYIDVDTHFIARRV